MSRIRLLHVVGASNFGGAAKLILRLAQMSVEDGWQVDILTTDPVFQQAARQKGIGVIGLDVIRREIRPWWDVWGLVRFYRFLRRERYHVVHTHTSKGGFVGRLAAWAAGVPAILHTVHGFAFHERSSYAKRAVYSLLERLASRWCDLIVAVTDFHRNWAVELGICADEQIIAIPNGITADQPSSQDVAADLRRQWNVGPGELVLLTAGRLAPEKGLEDLMEAGAILHKTGRPFRIVIAGNGPLSDQLITLAKIRGLADRVLFLGYREDIADLLAASDMVMLPSVREGLSIALLEAMAAGKPIVATRIGGNQAVVWHEETALLVPPGDPESLARAILRYWDEPVLRKTLGKQARSVFEGRFTEDRMLNSYRDIYYGLVEAHCSDVADSVKRGRPALELTGRADS